MSNQTIMAHDEMISGIRDLITENNELKDRVAVLEKEIIDLKVDDFANLDDFDDTQPQADEAYEADEPDEAEADEDAPLPDISACAILCKEHPQYRKMRGPHTYLKETHPAFGLKHVFWMEKCDGMLAARKLCPSCIYCSEDVQQRSGVASYYECRCE